MARIELDGVAHAYLPHPQAPEDFALKRLDLTWDDGSAYALLGPSGCGKTTLLNIISGLITPSLGKVLFDGRDVTMLATERRNIAQVFQFPVVYDTMTVFDNLAFPLRNRGLAASDVEARVRDIAGRLDLASDLSRRASGLTADQKQKISLGRGLVREDVAAILFDEPLTVIDPHLKWKLRSELKELHRSLGHTMVYVTHDQTEALTFADRVVVMYEGEVVQIGTPEELFERPAHTFVGYFIGSPGMNVLPADIEGAVARVGSHVIPLAATYAKPAPGARVEIGVRPEFVRLTSGADGVAVDLQSVEDVGRFKIARLRLEGRPVAAILDEAAPVSDSPRIRFEPTQVHVYADGHRLDAPQSGVTT